MTSRRLIVVDDDRSTADVVAKLLGDRGYQVDVACDGQTALQLISQHPYDLAVLDYQMPGLNGVEVFRRARELRPDLRGIFLTAYTTIDTVFPAVDAGIERVLSKPANAQELIPVVEQVLGTNA